MLWEQRATPTRCAAFPALDYRATGGSADKVLCDHQAALGLGKSAPPVSNAPEVTLDAATYYQQVSALLCEGGACCQTLEEAQQ